MIIKIEYIRGLTKWFDVEELCLDNIYNVVTFKTASGTYSFNKKHKNILRIFLGENVIFETYHSLEKVV